MTPSESVEHFYTAPNEVNLGQLRGEFADLMTVLISRFPERRTVLPARVNGVTRWYGIAPSEREGRLLREELANWLGEPISASNRSTNLQGDAVDLAAQRLLPSGTVLRIDVAPSWQDAARRNVASLTDIWALAPDRGMDQPRPVGRVLRQFYESLLALDRPTAEAAVDELRTRGLLSATNVRFLLVELIAVLGTPAELRDDPRLRDVSLLIRPPAVTERLAAAAQVLFIQPRLEQLEPSREWRLAASELEGVWPALVTHDHQITDVATARCFALGQLLVANPQIALLRQVQERFSDDATVQAITGELQLEEPPEALEQTPMALYYDGRYAEALTAAVAEESSRSATAIALAAAVNIADVPSAQQALALVAALSGPDRKVLLSSNVEQGFYSQLLAKTSDARVPRGWVDWLTGEWVDRPDRLAEWARGWQRSSEMLTSDGDAIAGGMLDALHDTRRGRVRNGVPVFVDWLLRDGLPPAGVPLAAFTFEILLSSEPGRTERYAALALLDEVLLVGCSRDEYETVLSAVNDHLDTLGPRDAAWLAQCLELLLLSSSPDASGRQSLVARAAGVALSWSDRVEETDGLLLNLVLSSAGVAPPIPEADIDVDAQDRRGERSFSRVGIYSLLEPAANLAASWIRQRWPSVDVTVSSEHVNTTPLAAFVRSADVLLVHTSHATHAATNAILALADPAKVVYVHGRGATSLFRACVDWSRQT